MSNFTFIVLWLVVMVILVIIEFMTLGLTCIWFAAGALMAAVVALCQGNIWLQLITFVLISLALLVLTRPLAQKYFNKKLSKTNLDVLIGEKCVVKEEINNLLATGVVTLDGKEWTARAAQDEDIIPIGTVVVLKEISGVKAIVNRMEEQI